MKKEGARDAAALLVIFTAGLLLHFIFADFEKAIRVAPDELRYYALARSLHDGNGLMLWGLHTDFQKVGYALFLAPLFGIMDGILRMKGIALLNAAWMMCGIFPAWKIAGLLKMPREQKYAAVLLMTVWPDLMYAATLMSEVFFWPIFLLFVYLWLLNLEKKSTGLAIAEGLLCYVGYLTKEIFLAALLAMLLFEVIYPFVQIDFGKECIDDGRRLRFRNGAKYSVVSAVVFVLTFITVKLLFFRHMGNSYDQMSLDALADPEHIYYFLYAVLYYLAAVVVASMVVPVIFSFYSYRSMKTEQKALFVFLSLFFVIAAATVAYTISIREDFAKLIPRVHLRYIAPALFLFQLLFLSILMNQKTKERKSMRPVEGVLVALSVALPIVIYKGIDADIPVDGQELNWNAMIAEWVEAGKFLHKKLTVCLIVFLLCFLFCVIMRLVIKNGAQKTAARFFAAAAGIVCIINSLYAQKIFYAYYHMEETLIRDATAISDYLLQDDSQNVLFVSAGLTDAERCVDTYVNISKDLYFTVDSYIREQTGNEIILKDTIIPAGFFYGGQKYRMNEAAYIIVDKQANLGEKTFANVEKIDGLSQGAYIVYRNKDPKRLYFESR